ncbi:hypothetical protein [Shewanella xiamenensis]|uniref:hypothetical protein n=1 Tax=Shewanella xiamenensis TaxID=332186 RepID=UPI0035B73DA2
MANTKNQLGGEVVSTTAFVLAQPHLATFVGGTAFSAQRPLLAGNSEAEKAAKFKSALKGVLK